VVVRVKDWKVSAWGWHQVPYKDRPICSVIVQSQDAADRLATSWMYRREIQCVEGKPVRRRKP
jgi:hypothetical protein